MRLHRIRLTSVRGIVERSVQLPEVGVTVIEGPNEAGKTTMAEAVDVLFEAKDSSKSQQVRDLEAAGTDIGPRVEVEFSTKHHRGVYVKQWLRGRTTQLTLTSPRREQLTGDEAHDRVRQILSADVDWAMWRAMRVVQGESLTPAPWQSVPSLGQALDRAAAELEACASSDCTEPEDLYARVRAESARFFTPKAGQPTGELASATATYELFRNAAEELRLQVQRAQADVDEAARLEHALADVGEQEGRLSDELKQARDGVAHLDSLRSALQEAERGCRRAADDVAVTGRESAQRDRDVQDVAQRAQLAGELRPRVEQQQNVCLALTERHGVAVEQVSLARDVRAQARQHASRLRVRAVTARRRRDLTELTDRLAAASQHRELSEQAAVVLAQCAVDDALLQQIEQAETAVWRAENARDLAAATMTVVQLGHQPVEVDGAPLDNHSNAGPGAEAEVSITRERSLEVPGVVRLTVRPGSTAADLDAEVGSARSWLLSLLERAGVQDLMAARAAVERRRAAQQQRQLAEAALGQSLGADTWKSLLRRADALRSSLVDESVSDTAADQKQDDDGDLDDAAEQAARQLEEHECHLNQAERIRDECAAAHTAAHQHLGHLQHQLETHEQEHCRLSDRLAQARRERDDEALGVAAQVAKRRLAELEEQAEHRRIEVTVADPEAVATRLADAEALAEALSIQRRELQSLADQVRGRLVAVETLGLSDRLTDAMAAQETAQRELLSVQRQARAARLLERSMSARRDEVRGRYLTPYRTAVQRLGRTVFGEGFDVEVDADLRVVSRTLDGCTLPVSSLSGGAREQLTLIERLACAELVEPDDGVPVIIDDALGFSDPQRLRSLGALLSSAGQHSQVIVLTCQPGRYKDVDVAGVIQLDA